MYVRCVRHLTRQQQSDNQQWQSAVAATNGVAIAAATAAAAASVLYVSLSFDFLSVYFQFTNWSATCEQ